MKTLSLKLDDFVYQETEELLLKIKKPRNRYINEALQHYNRIQKKKILEKLLEAESKLVSDESMKVLSEFEKLDDYDSYKI
jgi:predicted transcriptional regulator